MRPGVNPISALCPVRLELRRMDVEQLRRFYDSVAADFDRMPALVDEIVDPDIEFVTRDGRQRGKAAFRSHNEGWLLPRESSLVEEISVDDVIDAGDGNFVVLLTSHRRNVEKEDEYLRAWPAHVWRFDGNKAVFFEGYVNRAAALKAVGLTE
jgi:ketosteroid isomerase-like protein